MPRKPQAGKCGRCGRAVVVEEVQGPQDVGAVLFWEGGHRYEWDELERAWRLTAVRCDDHGDMPGDPRAAWCEITCEGP